MAETPRSPPLVTFFAMLEIALSLERPVKEYTLVTTKIDNWVVDQTRTVKWVWIDNWKGSTQKGKKNLWERSWALGWIESITYFSAFITYAQSRHVSSQNQSNVCINLPPQPSAATLSWLLVRQSNRQLPNGTLQLLLCQCKCFCCQCYRDDSHHWQEKVLEARYKIVMWQNNSSITPRLPAKQRKINDVFTYHACSNCYHQRLTYSLKHHIVAS